jgi:hypothetical protein
MLDENIRRVATLPRNTKRRGNSIRRRWPAVV